MILAIFGYGKTGKTLLFNLLAEQHEEVSKFSAGKTELHKAIVEVPDERLRKISQVHKTPPVYARIEFLDTGSMAYGETKDSAFLTYLRKADGLVHVARGFKDPEILHPLGSIDPYRDINNMNEELKAVDFLSIEKRIEKIESDLKKIKSDSLTEECDLLKKLKSNLEEGISLKNAAINPHEKKLIKGFCFLSLKPVMHVINSDEISYNIFRTEKLKDQADFLIFSAKIEKELLELEPQERSLFEKEYQLQNYAYIKDTFINNAYHTMNLISFFTLGKDETRAWTIKKGTNSLLAAGKIHSDISQGFIRAEVINWDNFLKYGSFKEAKKSGILKLEGKEYLIKDGEIVHFRFNKT